MRTRIAGRLWTIGYNIGGRRAEEHLIPGRRREGSRFLGDNFSVAPEVDGRAVGARGLAGYFSGAPQGTASRCQSFSRRFGSSELIHGPISKSRAVGCELSY